MTTRGDRKARTLKHPARARLRPSGSELALSIARIGKTTPERTRIERFFQRISYGA
jgi:hypothetical protein